MHRAVFTVSTPFLQITIRSDICFATSGLVILAFTTSMRHSETIGGLLERPHREIRANFVALGGILSTDL
jgi:hypothetical protein